MRFSVIGWGGASVEHWEVLAALLFFFFPKTKQNPSQLIIIISLGNLYLQKSHRTGKAWRLLENADSL